ncbi:hypothetical protein CIHG_00855 [Coccidioides immitis H538.4]|uniref:Uncharacterized protein n=3 Tax=Coccidioides immitis TaxID=5501 RepID=A0A0J8QL85_COCIT|nr:hypothetical protein CIRG_03271 [Coccidioides immitis RMSCC 2394]KMU73166.1 hypothetical protein CISG_03427 [Coccidioides immitis RMSCC 3703]KMU83073.1 hypothetical protein CIHG_00855 [Coccidioides immitis H538.4]
MLRQPWTPCASAAIILHCVGGSEQSSANRLLAGHSPYITTVAPGRALRQWALDVTLWWRRSRWGTLMSPRRSGPGVKGFRSIDIRLFERFLIGSKRNNPAL